MAEGELLVWPWTGILAIATQDDGTLAAHARQQHPAAVANTALQQQDEHHHSLSFLVLHFGKSQAGFLRTMSLADRFAGAGKMEWRQHLRRLPCKCTCTVMYGWMAGVEDLHGDDAVGRFLREIGAVARSAEDVFGSGDSAVAVADEPPTKEEEDEKYAWPWCGILAAGAGFNADIFADKVAMFNSDAIAPLVFDEAQGMESFAIVKFNGCWGGCRDAFALGFHFSMIKLGRKEWEDRNIAANIEEKEEGDIKVYGWLAREVDYNARDVVGRYLRKHTNLMTVDEITKEKSAKMVETLESQIEEKNKFIKDLESKKNRTELSIARLGGDNMKSLAAYNEEMRNLHCKAGENALRIFHDNEKLKLEIENKKRELSSRAKQLEKLTNENANDRKKLSELADEKQKAQEDGGELELGKIEQERAGEDILKLFVDQKREKEDALARMLELEKELHEKRELELEVTQLNGTLQVMKHLEGDDDGDIHNKMEKLSERLEHEKMRLEELSGELVRKERESNNELQESRKELIEGLEDMLSGRTVIGIKRMGEIDEKPFQNACRRKYGNNDFQEPAAELVSSWQEEIKKSSWQPYKIVSVNGEDKEIVDDDDPRLRNLSIEYGDDVCNAVKTALLEVNEHNPSGRYTVSELWNFRQHRKATLKEVLEYIFKEMKTTSKRRRC